MGRNFKQSSVRKWLYLTGVKFDNHIFSIFVREQHEHMIKQTTTILLYTLLKLREIYQSNEPFYVESIRVAPFHTPGLYCTLFNSSYVVHSLNKLYFVYITFNNFALQVYWEKKNCTTLVSDYLFIYEIGAHHFRLVARLY